MSGAGAPARIATLDLLRGIAVLGIVAVNVAGFAGPRLATETPNLPVAASPLDEAAFAFVLLVFEGKMRALFSMLFGASMLLFVERAEARGRDGDWLQMRRLFWLALIGYAHGILLWWGDILFVYAVAGTLALMLRRLPVPALLVLSAAIFIGWHGWGTIDGLPGAMAEAHVRAGTAGAAELARHAADLAATLGQMRGDIAQAHLGFAAMVADKLANAPFWPVTMALYTIGETLPLMLIGMVLLRTGFFAGGWSPAALGRLAMAGIGIGGVSNTLLIGWAWANHFPPLAMAQWLAYWSAVPHVLMALGYAAALVLGAPRFAPTALGRHLSAAGRVAFSNYLLTTLAMTALFYGWGLDRSGTVSPAWQLPLVAGWWLVMLGWSAAWLARFRQGPLEWAWRSLTEGRPLPMRRA